MKVNFNVLNQKSAPALYESSLANRPTAGYMGRLFIDTDIPSTGIYWDSGTAWYKIASASIAETQSLNDVCVIGNNTVTLGTYIYGQSTYGQKSGAAIPVEPNYALTIGRGDSVNDKSLYVAFNSILNGLVNVIGGNTASNPGLKVSGGWYSGGSATTTKPQLLVEPDGTTSTAWSTLGTGIGINAATGFTGNLIDLKLAGVSKAKFDYSGTLSSTTGLLGYSNTSGSHQIGNVLITSSSITAYGNMTISGNAAMTFSNPLLNFALNQNWAPLGFIPTNAVVNGINLFGAYTNVGAGGLSTGNLFNANVSVATTVGSPTLNNFNVVGTYNTSGGTTLVRGFYFNPTVSGSTGLTMRSIETATGNVILGSTSGSVGIGANTSINNSAILDITSTTQGLLFPRMTTVQKTAITTPAAGLVVYDTTLNKLCVFTTAWETITSI